MLESRLLLFLIVRPARQPTTEREQVFQLCDLADESMQAVVLGLPRKASPTVDGGWFRQGDLDDLRDRIKVKGGGEGGRVIRYCGSWSHPSV